MAERIDPAEITRFAREALKKSLCLSFLFDYDGTLTPIVRYPELAIISEEMRAALDILNRADSVRIAIISGRPVKELRERIGNIENIPLVGNHGFEVEGEVEIDTGPLNKQIAQWETALKAFEEKFPGCRVENKQIALSVHYRNVNPAQEPRLMKDFFLSWDVLGDDRGFQIMAGKKVFEIRPRSINKGAAALRMFETWHGTDWDNKAVAFYFGDDTTDEDVFRVLNRFPIVSAITVFVGDEQPTAARYRLENVEEVKICIMNTIDALNG